MKHSSKSNSGFTSFMKIAAWPLLGITIMTVIFLIQQKPSEASDVIVYKNPSCGCCKKWVSHLEDNGFSVEVRNLRDVSSIKKELGVPRHMSSCHTAKVGGYVVEGHVPADVIVRLLEETPEIVGLAVPGMPMGSPGMEGPRKDSYDVLTFGKGLKTDVYASR